jgi:hypothetical protein
MYTYNNKMDDLSIFFKKKGKKISPEPVTISREELMSTIPDDAVKVPDIKKADKHREHRWRIIKLPDREAELIEISVKDPDKNRIFISQNGTWIEYSESHLYDKYVTDEYYYYN